MKNSILILLVLLTLPNFLSAKIADNEDTLSLVASKLGEINKKLEDPRVLVSPKSFQWPELQQLRQDFMFAAAHDPAGKITQEISQELSPQNLTSKVQNSFLSLEMSAKQIGTLTQTEQWLALKKDIEFFVSNRKLYLYGPARSIIRSGSVSRELQELERIAREMILPKDSEQGMYSVKVLDPYFNEMASELKVMNKAVSKIQSSLTPKPVIKESIFVSKNYKELALLSLFAGIFGILTTLVVQYVNRAMKRPKVVPVTEPAIHFFDYSEWLQRLEVSLKTFKVNDEKTIESHIKLKDICKEFSKARKDMNLAENQKDFYSSLDMLNIHAPRIEEHFENFDIVKNADLSRKLVKLIVQLCEAIEKNQRISFSGPAKTVKNYPRQEKVALEAA